MNTLQEIISESDNIVFFGGAGVSTASGLPDFRSKDGLYSLKYKDPPETMLSHSFFVSHTKEFFEFYKDKLLLSGILPNAAHKFLAKLEEKGKLKAVITQNIDGLHQDAGSKNVLELHGTSRIHYCMSCKTLYPVEKIKNERVPKCDKCGDVIRPKVTLYEEALDEVTVDTAIDHIYASDLLIIGGTSLAVYPAAV